MCSFAQFLTALLGPVWPFIVTYGQTVPQLILAISALYAFCYIIGSRLAEHKLEAALNAGESVKITDDLRKTVNIRKDLATLVPNWMLVIVFFALAWRMIYLLRGFLVQVCGG